MSNTGSERDAVLLPTGLNSHSYITARSLSQHGIHTVLASDRADLPVYAGRYSDEAIVIPSAEDDLIAYKDALIGIGARPDIRTIIPAQPQDTYLLSKYEEEFEEYVSVVTPSFESLKNVHDRLRLSEIAEEAGVPVPETRLLTEVDDWSPELIVKSRYNLLAEEYADSYTAHDMGIVKTVKHLQPGEEPNVTALCEEMEHTPIVQEYVHSSDEYVFGALYDHGEAKTTFQHRQVRGDSYTGGGGVYRKSVHIPELEEVGRRLLDALDWHGLACIEYMQDAETGEFKLTEINPRMWQSLPCAVRAGADFPHDFWLLATGQGDRIEPGYKVGVGSHYLYGEMKYLASLLQTDSSLIEPPAFASSIGDILSSIITEPHFDTVHLDDPLPIVYGVREAVRKARRPD